MNTNVLVLVVDFGIITSEKYHSKPIPKKGFYEMPIIRRKLKPFSFLGIFNINLKKKLMKIKRLNSTNCVFFGIRVFTQRNFGLTDPAILNYLYHIERGIL